VKRSTRMSLVFAALAAAFPIGVSGASAGPTEGRVEAITQLESRAVQVDAKLNRTVRQGRTDVTRHIQRKQLRDERNRVRELIGRLEAGQQVDPAEIDRALGPGPR